MVILAIANNSRSLIWDTSTAIETEFCEHRYRQESPHYQAFLNNMVFAAHMVKDPLLQLNLIKNIIVVKPEFIQCHPTYLNIVIETHHDTPELRYAIKAFAMSLKFAIAIRFRNSNTQIRILMKVQDRDREFLSWMPHKGFYLFRE